MVKIKKITKKFWVELKSYLKRESLVVNKRIWMKLVFKNSMEAGLSSLVNEVGVGPKLFTQVHQYNGLDSFFTPGDPEAVGGRETLSPSLSLSLQQITSLFSFVDFSQWVFCLCNILQITFVFIFFADHINVNSFIYLTNIHVFKKNK